MGYAQETGYTPSSIDTILTQIMNNINVQFQLDPPYTMETFIGTNAYKYFYALAQEAQENEVKTSEIFLKLQNYFDQINARIARPVVTQPGTIELIEKEGFQTSVKPMILADAGTRSICIDVDDGDHAYGEVKITSYANLISGTADKVTIGATQFTAQAGAATPGAATFQAATSNTLTATSLAAQINAHATASTVVRARAQGAIVYLTALHGGTAGNAIVLTYTNNDGNVGATVTGSGTLEDGTTNADYEDLKEDLCLLISQCTAGGIITKGTESENIVLSNGQSETFKYYLPNRLPTTLRLTTTLSENNQILIGSPDEVKQKLLANVLARYRLGRNFEPQRYFSVVDAPWAASVLLEYSTNYDPDAPGDAIWSSAIYDAAFDDLFEVSLENIILVEA